MENKKKQLEIRMTESYVTWVVRDSIKINVEDYPELNGMSEEDMKDYIMSNASEMKPTNEDWCDSLYDELMSADVVRDKITNEDSEIVFD
jgi:hypothetical protein